jgi:hypothetical protein
VNPDAPLVPSPLYGLRTWTVAGERGAERLAGAQRTVTWPPAGDWLAATCPEQHAAPAHGCACGIHAWHPRPRWARRVLAARREVPGVVEASGAIEVHEDGFRAERARPHALMLAPGRNPGLVRRLAATYRVPVVEAADAGVLMAWCRERGLGLDEGVVAELIGAAELEARRRARRRRARVQALRTAAVVALVAGLLAAGLVVTDDPGDRTLYGRTGEVRPGR